MASARGRSPGLAATRSIRYVAVTTSTSSETVVVGLAYNTECRGPCTLLSLLLSLFIPPQFTFGCLPLAVSRVLWSSGRKSQNTEQDTPKSSHDSVPTRSRYLGGYISESAAKGLHNYQYAGRYAYMHSHILRNVYIRAHVNARACAHAHTHTHTHTHTPCTMVSACSTQNGKEIYHIICMQKGDM